jgi:hypothetical protein
MSQSALAKSPKAFEVANLYGRLLRSWPETGFEEIGVTESLFLEADFGGVRGSHRNKGVSQAGI